jgi:hypothetical protein
MKIEVCPISGSKDAIKFLDLGMIPIEGNLSKNREESLNVKKYSMVLQFFPKSKLVTLEEIVNPDDIYLNYLYHSGISKPYIEHCDEMFDYLEKYVDVGPYDIIADIGGNDGSLLLEFQKKAFNAGLFDKHLLLLNVECSKSFKDINKTNGILYINEYFGEKTDLRINYKKPILITSTNVFQHTEPLRSFIKGIYNNLSNDSVWCLEFPYLVSTLINDIYDQAYHEHVYYYCLSALKTLFEQEGLRIINVSYHKIHTGTLRIISAKNDSELQSDSTIESFINLEEFINKKYLLNWGKRIQSNIERYSNFLLGVKNSGYKIAGFGAAIKGCVFLNTCKIDYNILDYVIDDTPEKQGKFVPGTGIEVMSREILKTNPPDYILILAHNFKEYIIKSIQNEYKGKFIVMFPDITVIE